MSIVLTISQQIKKIETDECANHWIHQLTESLKYWDTFNDFTAETYILIYSIYSRLLSFQTFKIDLFLVYFLRYSYYKV